MNNKNYLALMIVLPLKYILMSFYKILENIENIFLIIKDVNIKYNEFLYWLRNQA